MTKTRGEENRTRAKRTDDAVLSPQRLRAQMLAALPELTPSYQKLARYLIDNFEAASDLTLHELAAKTGVSATTVSQFCRALNLDGYQDLRLRLAREAVLRTSPAESNGLDGRLAGKYEPGSPALALLSGSIDALVETASALDAEAVARAVGTLWSARRVEICGVGSAGLIAAEAALKWRKLGVDAVAHPDGHVQAMSASQLDERDALVAISHSGRTRETLSVTNAAARAGATTIGITNAAESPLAGLVDVLLATVSYDYAYHIEPTASGMAEMWVVQLLFVLLLEHGGDAAQASLRATQEAVDDRAL